MKEDQQQENTKMQNREQLELALKKVHIYLIRICVRENESKTHDYYILLSNVIKRYTHQRALKAT